MGIRKLETYDLLITSILDLGMRDHSMIQTFFFNISCLL